MRYEWPDNLARICGLWPSWEPTQEQGDLFRQRLSSLNQDWLRTAIDTARENYASNEPKLKWMMQEFNKIKEGHSQAGVRREIQQSDDSPDWAAIDADDARALARLRTLPPAVLQRVADETRKYAPSLPTPAPPDPDDWGRSGRGYADAVANRLHLCQQRP